MLNELLLIVVTLSWVNDCKAMVVREVGSHNPVYIEELIRTIPQGIQLANIINEKNPTDEENMDRCALTLAVAKFESTFNPLAKNGTCLGMFQIKPSTAKDIVKDQEFLNGRNLKSMILTSMAGTCFFNLLIDDFVRKYKTTFRALVRYNNSEKISKRIMKYYRSIKDGRIGRL